MTRSLSKLCVALLFTAKPDSVKPDRLDHPMLQPDSLQ